MAEPTLGAMIAAMGSPAEWGAIPTSKLFWDDTKGLSIGVDVARDSTTYGRGLQITRAASNTGQHISMIRNGNAIWSLGYLYGTNTFAIGSGQSTDSSFNAANSVLSCSLCKRSGCL